MVFWLGILVGGLFAWLAVKIGFYETWTMLFNIVISIYVAVFLGPVILDIIPAAGDTAFGKVLAMITTGVGVFLILHCISYTFLTGQFSVSFPGIFNTLGAALLGFVAGFLVWSFVSLLICISPISQNSIIKGLGFGSESQQANISYIGRWCDLVNKVVASEESESSARETIGELLGEKKQVGEPAEPNEPGVGDI